MAKLPTFEAKRASGGAGGIVQMTPQERSMRKSFRKSANMKASDIYQSAGTLALADSIGKIGLLANKIQAKKRDTEEAEAEVRQVEWLSQKKAEMRTMSNDADFIIEKSIVDNEKALTTTKSGYQSDRLTNKFRLRAANLRADALLHSHEQSRKILLSEMDTLGNILMSDRSMTIEQKNAEYIEAWESKRGGLFGDETTNDILRKFNQNAIKADFDYKLDLSEDVNELESLSEFFSVYEDQIDPNVANYMRDSVESKMSARQAKVEKSAKLTLADAVAFGRRNGYVTPEHLDAMNGASEEFKTIFLNSISSSILTKNARTEVDAIDAATPEDYLNKTNSIIEKYKKDYRFSEESVYALESYKAGVVRALNERDKMHWKAQAATLANGLREEIAAKGIVDKSAANSLARKIKDGIPVKHRSMVSAEIDAVMAEYKSNPSQFTAENNKLFQDVNNARISGNRENEVMSFRRYMDSLPDYNTRVVDNGTMEGFYNIVRNNDGESWGQGVEYLGTLYGDDLGKALLDIGQRINEGNVPEGFSEEMGHGMPIMIDQISRGKLSNVNLISNAIDTIRSKNYVVDGKPATRDATLKKYFSEIQSLQVPGDELRESRLEVYLGLRGSGVARKDAQAIVYDGILSVDDQLVPSEYRGSDGAIKTVDESQLNISVGQGQRYMFENIEKVADMGQLSTLYQRIGPDGDKTSVKFNFNGIGYLLELHNPKIGEETILGKDGQALFIPYNVANEISTDYTSEAHKQKISYADFVGSQYLDALGLSFTKEEQELMRIGREFTEQAKELREGR